jgi:hypothetical protein
MNKRAASGGTHQKWRTRTVNCRCVAQAQDLFPCANKEMIISQIIPAAAISLDWQVY